MECIEARALKSSFLSQMDTKTTNSHQPFQNEDVWCFTGINTDDFLVEDLLNLDFPEEIHEDVGDDDDNNNNNNNEKVSLKRNSNCSESIFSGSDEFDCLSAGELTVPAEELENLEWLSQFVDDTTSEPSLLLPTGSFSANSGASFMARAEPVRRPVQSPCFNSPIPVKARTKRSRSNGRPWSLSSPQMSAAESSTTSSSSNGSSTFIFTDLFHSVEKPLVKKLKRNPESETGSITGRRCTHCQVQKTPQWRSGPLGPKTLCNACGVRFKSGRLYPEYRPACSPTFSQEVHSNSHRKVLEMRRKKEVGPVAEAGLARAVQSF